MQTDTTNDDRQSPRISFSLNLSQTDGISPEKRTSEDVTYDTDFEFCVISNNNNNGLTSIIEETLLPVSDELFRDGKILPLIQRPIEAQPVTFAGHLSLEISRCRSPVRSISSPPSKITSSCSGNVGAKSLCKEITFKLSNKESTPAENKRTDQDGSGNIVKQQTSLCPISRSCSTGGEMKGNCLFCSLPCSRIKRKYKAAASKDIDPDVPGIVEGSKRLEARRISNKVQPDPPCLGELKPMKPRFKLVEDGKEETKGKQTADRGKLGSTVIPASRMRGGIRGQRTAGKVGGNERSMVRNLERSSSNIAVKAASLDSPPPGKPMAEGYLLVKANNSNGAGEVKISPVVNVSVCIGYAGGCRWNGVGGLFGFFSKTKREKKQTQPSAYNLHHSHATNTNRKKGT